MKRTRRSSGGAQVELRARTSVNTICRRSSVGAPAVEITGCARAPRHERTPVPREPSWSSVLYTVGAATAKRSNSAMCYVLVESKVSKEGRLHCLDDLLTYLLVETGVRLHPPGRTDKNLCRCFGAPALRVFPHHLITCGNSVRWFSPMAATRAPCLWTWDVRRRSSAWLRRTRGTITTPTTKRYFSRI